MNIYKKLVNNSFIFALGNLGSKLITFLLVPLYTYYLSTSEYGTVDLLTITVSFLMPIFTLSISDAVLRFVMDKHYDKRQVLINSLIITLLGFLFLIFFYPFIKLMLPFESYVLYLYILILIQSIFVILTQYVRASGMVKLFALSGVFHAFSLLILNIIFLVGLNNGIIGYLVSILLSYVISSVFVIFKGKLFNDLILVKVNAKLIREMLIYSIPLIPNAVMWWIMSFSDRYLITFFLGLSANGLYAVANKIPSILNIVHSIFFQAWQMSAIEEAESRNKSEFFTNVFNVFSVVMLLSTSVLLVFLKFIMDFFVSEAYFDSWKYIPFLLLSVVFSSYSGFLGTNYIAAKKTGGIFKTSIMGAILNIIANIVLIPIIGINGAAIGTMLSFALIWILRIIDTRKFVIIKVNFKKMLCTLIVIYLQIGVLYLNISFEYLIQMSLLCIVILINYREIRGLVMKIKRQ